MQQTSMLLLGVAGVAWLTGWAPAALITLPELALGSESWRLVSGHFAHADGNHWLMNSAGLLACGLLFERACRIHFTGLLVTGMAFVTVWLVTWSSLSAYCGLSGALNAVFVGGCLVRYCVADTWAQQPSLRYLWLLLPLLDLAKIGVEFSSGQALFSDSSWAPAPLAHLAGWLAGAIYVGVLSYGTNVGGRTPVPIGGSPTATQLAKPLACTPLSPPNGAKPFAGIGVPSEYSPGSRSATLNPALGAIADQTGYSSCSVLPLQILGAGSIPFES